MISASDYIYNLRGLKYPSEEYVEMRTKVIIKYYYKSIDS